MSLILSVALSCVSFFDGTVDSFVALQGEGALHPRQRAEVVLMEPVESFGGVSLPTYQRVTDEDRIQRCMVWLDNARSIRALELYHLAWSIAHPEEEAAGSTSSLHIALIPGGNHAGVGFQLKDGAQATKFPELAFVKLDESRDRFGLTLLHETGHAMLATLTAGKRVSLRRIASIPHTTAALTNRGTAFDEGFAIHLETLAAHFDITDEGRRRYRHNGFDFGSSGINSSEYYRHSVDLASFSQSRARYQSVRDNDFAFASAYQGSDYLRTQLEKSRDFSILRNANQLLQSEGFHASFFFSLMVHGLEAPSQNEIAQRQAKMLTVLAESLLIGIDDPETPHLIQFVQSYAKHFPKEAKDVINVLLDLSHGVFLDADAQDLWREHYLAALRLDLSNLNRTAINAARQDWRAEALADPMVLQKRLGPQLPCRVPEKTVTLVALGDEAPLAFDLNTVQSGILRLVPGITEKQIQLWITERDLNPFQSFVDFNNRVPLHQDCIAGIKFSSAEPDGKVEANPAFQLQYEPVDHEIAQKLVPLIEAGMKTVEGYFGRPFKHSFRLEILPDRDSFTASFPPEWGMTDTQCWMVATGVSDALRLLSPRVWNDQACEHDPDDFSHVRGIIIHELVHVFHGQYNPTGDFVGAEEVGAFGEGLAVFVSGQLEDERHSHSASEALEKGLEPKSIAESWSGPYRYGVTGSIVEYLAESLGRDKLFEMLSATEMDQIFSIAGISETELLAHWADSIRQTSQTGKSDDPLRHELAKGKCSVTLPNDSWNADPLSGENIIGRFSSDDGVAHIDVQMPSIFAAASMKDLKPLLVDAISKRFDGYEIVSESDITLGDLDGFEVIFTYTDKDEPRKSMLLMTKKGANLFMVRGHAPIKEFDRFKESLQKICRSLLIT